jgi:hypothetical protein
MLHIIEYIQLRRKYTATQARTHTMTLLRTTLPRITRSAPFPPVSSRDVRSCRELVSLPINTTEETHETLDIGLGLWPLSDLCIMRDVQVKGKCALGPFLSILVIGCQHGCLNVYLCNWRNKVQIKITGMFLSLSTLVLCTNILV